jgi:dimethylhistidine N-methyltransferase
VGRIQAVKRTRDEHHPVSDSSIDSVLQPDPHTEISNSLLASQAAIAPKYFYDQLGSSLFSAICHLEEYYPTRTEASIFQSERSAIARQIHANPVMIDLGAADCAKGESWFDALTPSEYIAIDISAEYLASAMARLKASYPNLPLRGLGMDFSSQLVVPEDLDARNKLFFYPGSSIGNFTRAQAVEFLKQISRQKNSQLLIGVDFFKSLDVLIPAYDDSLGVTASFNLNALQQVNKLVQANFNPRDWRHEATFCTEISAVQMWLVAKQDVTVRWSSGPLASSFQHERTFAQGQRIHTENSHKYSPEGFTNLLLEAGFKTTQYWSDSKNWFGVFLAKN